MASREEYNNKPKCKSNVNNDEETNFITVYKKLEQVLNSKNETFPKKVESLIEVWRQVCLYSLSDKIPYVVQLMDWAKFHTLNIVLNGDWKKFKDVYEQKLLHEVQDTESVLLKLNNIFSMRCKKLAEVIRDPWGNPVLYRLLNTPDITIGPEEIEFFCIETGCLVSHRLKKLCESHCEDLALNLVTAFMNCYRIAETQQFNLNATEEQKWFIFDIYIALLFKFKKTSQILSVLKGLSLKDGLELVKRFTHKRVKISKIWRHSGKIAQLACQVYVASTVTKPLGGEDTILKELLKIWFMQNQTVDGFEPLCAALRRVVLAAESANHLYIFCEALYENFGSKMKTFIVELYIRALTTDMNILERLKNEKETETEKAAETATRMAEGFCRLADILVEHVKVTRECALTAFSLRPSKQRLKRIEDLARQCGYTVLDTGQDWKCKLHPPVLPSDELCWICDLCGDYMSQPQIEAAINTNTALCEALSAEQLGLSRQLCDDLAVVLSGPRYQVFSWLLRWEDLHRLCIMYLNDPERTKNLVTELKFVDIDYSIFMSIKREPEDEAVTGIERGYEHYLETEFYSDEETPLSEDSASQDSRPYSLGSDGAGENPSCFLPPPKSDPDVLKSLRMFRPNLKRARPVQSDENSANKVFVRSNSTFVIPELNTPKPNRTNYPYPADLYSGLYDGTYANHKKNDWFDHFEPKHNNAENKFPTSTAVNGAVKPPFDSLSPGSHQNLVTCSKSWQQKVPYPAHHVSERHTNLTSPVHNDMPALHVNNSTKWSKASSVPTIGHQNNAHPKNGVTARILSIRKEHHLLKKELNVPPVQSIINAHKKEDCQTTSAPIRHSLTSYEHSTVDVDTSKDSLSRKEHSASPFRDNELSADVDEIESQLPTKEFSVPPFRDSKVSNERSEIDNIDKLKDRLPSKGLPFQNNRLLTEQSLIVEKMRDHFMMKVCNSAVPFRDSQLPTEQQPVMDMNKKVNHLLTKESNVHPFQDSLLSINQTPIIDIKGEDRLVTKKFNISPVQDSKLSTQESMIDGNKIPCLENRTLSAANSATDEQSKGSPMIVSVDDFEKFSNKVHETSVVEMKPVKEKCTEVSPTKLKEAKVLLNRINIKQYINKKLKLRCKEHSSEKELKRKDESGAEEQQNNSGLNKPWQLHDMNPRVVLQTSDILSVGNKSSASENNKSPDSSTVKRQNYAQSTKDDSDSKAKSPVIKNFENLPKQTFTSRSPKNRSAYPCVLLERLNTNKKYVKSVLANVPGLNDLQLIRPSGVDQIVQVVQIAGGRQTSAVPSQNTQTSTQVSPHIQRVGQPRSNDKPEQTSNDGASAIPATDATTTAPVSKPTTSQSSALINILSQDVIRPSPSNCTRTRNSPLINILSQRIIRPGNGTLAVPKTTSSSTTAPEANQRPITASEPQVIGQLTNPVNRNTASTIKTAADQNRIVQFICKSTDGKLIPVTSFTPNRVVKVATTQTVSSTTSPTSPTYEEARNKPVKSPQKPKNESDNNAEALPKFQQAFGKAVYQNNMDNSSNATTIPTEVITSSNDAERKLPKTTSVSVQPIQGGVIYTRQMPVGQAINLIPPGRGQVFRIATSNSDHSVIHSKMSALLAAALQGKQKTSESAEIDSSSSEDSSGQRITVSKPMLVQNARMVKPVLHIPSNIVAKTTAQPNLSSTTLEQLREFDMVYKQVKERSSTSVASEPPTADTNENSQQQQQQKIITYLNQNQKFTQFSPVVVVSSYCNVQPAASPALSVTSQGSSSPCVTPAPVNVPKTSANQPAAIAVKTAKIKSVKTTTTNTSKASPIPKPQQKPQEDEHTTQRIFDILAEYAEQLRNSPDLNNKPAPRRRSNPPTNPNQSSKRKKSTSSKKTGQCSSTLSSDADVEDPRTVGSEDSSCGVVQISMQDEEQSQTATQTTESNDGSSSVGPCQQLILTDSTHAPTRNLIIADSTVGEALKLPNTAVLVPGNYIMPVSMVKGGQQIAVVSGTSKLVTVPARSGSNMLLLQSFINQNRKPGLPTVKYSTLQQISGGISSQTLTGVTAQPPVVLPQTTVALGQQITLKKLNQSDTINNTELLLAISQPQYTNHAPETGQLRSENSVTVTNGSEIEQNVSQVDNNKKVYGTQKTLITTTPIATPVISQVTKEDLVDEQRIAAQTIIALSAQESNKGETEKRERVQSVLVPTCSGNGTLLIHSPPNINLEQAKERCIRVAEKQNNNEQKQFPPNTIYYQKIKKPAQGAQRLDRELHQISIQRKQAALERELRLQKSLSEECEDLGVDEPSTSDLFPEADLLFDSNHSPSFDQSSQDMKRQPHPHEVKEEPKPTMTLFSDDDNSESLRADFLFETVEYQAPATQLRYEQRQLTNGQSSTSNESAGSSGEDNVLLPNCTSMSDVTLNSPMTPEGYVGNSTPPSLNKYKYEYANKKKTERNKPTTENWSADVSSSEDTAGSTELCTNKRGHNSICEDDTADDCKVARVALSNLKEDHGCDELHCEDADNSTSGRGARRSVKKLCSCCNGSSQDGTGSRKRPTSRPHTPASHKKAFLTKKR